MNTSFEGKLNRTRKSLPKTKALINSRWSNAGGQGDASPVFTKCKDCMQSVRVTCESCAHCAR